MRRAFRPFSFAGILLACALLGVGLSGCLRYHEGTLPNAPEGATYAEVEGGQLRYLDVGEGPAVVLIHGFASSLDAWGTVIPGLREDHHVLAMDMLGFGWSGRPVADYSPRAQALRILALMDQRGIERASIVAHSFGSSVALALALEAPERVERIVLYDAYVFADEGNAFFDWARADGMGEVLFSLYYDERPEDRIALAFFDPEALDQAFIDSVEGSVGRPGTTAAALATVRAMHLEELQQRYSEIDIPTLLIWGREDNVTPIRFGERLSEVLPQAELRSYPRCGHFPMLEARHNSLRDLQAFLSRPITAGGEAANQGAGSQTQTQPPVQPVGSGMQPSPQGATDAGGMQGGMQGGIQDGMESEMEASP